MKKLKIAVFCTNEWPTPPPQNTFYAPLWISYYIAEGLAKKGHKIYYFGPKESKLKYAKLVSFGMSAIKYNRQLAPFISSINEKVVNFYEQLMISKIYQLNQKEKFDAIHIHPYRRVIPFAPFIKTPTIITIHDPLQDFNKYMLNQTKAIKNIHLISISNSQRKPSPNLNYAGTVYNGINIAKFKFNEKPEDFFVAVGRFVPEKGIDIAVQVAKKAKIKLKIAGGPNKGPYFDKKIKPYLDKNIQYLGMINYYQMGELYKRAKGLLYPLRWKEPFGLVLIEAMACGTPVIAFNRGSVPEIIKDGKTGFIVTPFNKKAKPNIEGFVKAIKKIYQMSETEYKKMRYNCRKHVEKNFSLEKMTSEYEKIYSRVLKKERGKNYLSRN